MLPTLAGVEPATSWSPVGRRHPTEPPRPAHWDQSDLGLGSRCGFKIFNQAAILDSQTEWFKQFWISMSLQCFQSKFLSIQLTVCKMSFEEFQDGHHGSHLGYHIRTIFLILNLYVVPMSPIKVWLNPNYGFGGVVVWRISKWPPWHPSWISITLQCLPSSISSIWLRIWEEMSFEEFEDEPSGGHLGYQKGKILAILNFWVTMMVPIKFWLNLTYGLGENVIWKISRWPPWWPSWISEQNDFSNSESLCRSDASHLVSVQSDLWFGRRCHSESLCHCDASHQVSAQLDLQSGRRCHLKNFKVATMAALLDIRKERL